MKELSERAEREFEKWQEEYEIPLIEEFQVKTLLQLQEEYDNTEIGSHTTKTRESLINMIRSMRNNLKLREKDKTKTMYVDCTIRDNSKLKNIVVYLDNKLYILENQQSFKECASRINSIVSNKETKIYIDTTSFGMGLYDELIKYDNFYVQSLSVRRY